MRWVGNSGIQTIATVFTMGECAIQSCKCLDKTVITEKAKFPNLVGHHQGYYLSCGFRSRRVVQMYSGFVDA